MPEYMTAESIAALLELNPDHVRDRLSRQPGFPDAFRVGGSLRWRRADVDDWIEKQAISPAARRSQKRRAGSRSSARKGQSAPPSAPTPADRAPSTVE
jgi:prophage regulatory protein